MNVLIGTLLYSVHVVSLPAGWTLAQPWSSGWEGSRPVAAAIARNGAVGALIVRTGQPPNGSQRLLIVRRDGSRVVLRTMVRGMLERFGDDGVLTTACGGNYEGCPLFEGVTLADDGTPFVTVGHHFEGAYSGMRRLGFVWNGEWHLVQGANALAGHGNPSPDNISIAAAETASRFAYVSDYEDSTGAEMERGVTDPTYMAHASDVWFESRAIALGIGDATAMRGSFVAGFDAGLRYVGPHGEPAIALEWQCVRDRFGEQRGCTSLRLGRGMAYGVDARGDAVGDDMPSWPDRDFNQELIGYGTPMLWRGGTAVQLSPQYGSAYAISDDGTIVGAMSPPGTADRTGFIANARDAAPRARRLDPLVAGLGDYHVRAAFGIASDGRILVFLSNGQRKRVLAVLVPTAR